MTRAFRLIHTGTVNGKPLRYFAGPGPGPQLPWIALADFQNCLGLTEQMRQDMLQKLGEAGFRADVRSVPVDGEILVIGPHYMGQGLLSAAILPCCRDNIPARRTSGRGRPLNALTKGMQLFERLDFVIAASEEGTPQDTK